MSPENATPSVEALTRKRKGGRPRKNPNVPVPTGPVELSNPTKLGIPELAELWEVRQDTATALYGKEDGEKFVEALEQLADGDRWNAILGKIRMDWGSFNQHYLNGRPQAKALQHAAVELCRKARQMRLEDEAFRRGVEGVDEPVYTQAGRLAGYKKRHSDMLLALMLRAHDPDRYGDRGVAGNVQGVVLNVNLDIQRDQPPTITIDSTESSGKVGP